MTSRAGRAASKLKDSTPGPEVGDMNKSGQESGVCRASQVAVCPTRSPHLGFLESRAGNRRLESWSFTSQHVSAIRREVQEVEVPARLRRSPCPVAMARSNLLAAQNWGVTETRNRR